MLYTPLERIPGDIFLEDWYDDCDVDIDYDDDIDDYDSDEDDDIGQSPYWGHISIF